MQNVLLGKYPLVCSREIGTVEREVHMKSV